jgi:hypothetical protein
LDRNNEIGGSYLIKNVSYAAIDVKGFPAGHSFNVTVFLVSCRLCIYNRVISNYFLR